MLLNIHFIKNQLFSILLILSLLLFLFFIQTRIDKTPLSLSAQEKRLSFSTNFFNFFNFGQKRLISSMMWIETLIQADHEHFKPTEEIQHSWLFYRFKSIVTIDPYFYEAYLYGGQHLSIIKDDPHSAAILLDKGIEYFPDDYWINYYSAYNEYFELQNIPKAKKHYQRMIQHPISFKYPIIHSLYARLLSDKSDMLDHIKIMLEIYQNLEDEKIAIFFKQTIERHHEKICNNRESRECSKITKSLKN